jgi:hypothetical protein
VLASGANTVCSGPQVRAKPALRPFVINTPPLGASGQMALGARDTRHMSHAVHMRTDALYERMPQGARQPNPT